MNNEMRELNNAELIAIAGGIPIVFGSPATPADPVSGDGNPFMGIVWIGSPFAPVVVGIGIGGGGRVKPSEPGKP